MYKTLDQLKHPITLLLKGEPGSGKTRKAAMFPSPVFFNFDNNLSGLRKLPESIRKNVKVVDPFVDAKGNPVPDTKIWDNFVRLLAEVVQDPNVKTVVIDSLTTLASRLMDQILNSSAPTTKVMIQHWGDFARYLKWFGDEFLCDPTLDKHVIVIAHELMDKNEQTGEVKYLLNLGGQMKDSFDLYFSDVWRCYTKIPMSGDTEYRVRTIPSNQARAKNSIEGLPADFVWDKEAQNIIAKL